MTSNRREVIVVGGSLGGLFAAVALKRLGHSVRIFERTPSFVLKNQGAGIIAGPEVQSFLSKYDATHCSFAVRANLRHYLNRNGQEIRSEELDWKTTSWDVLYYLLRANLDGFTGGYCKSPPMMEDDGQASYDYDHKVTNIRMVSEDLLVEYEDQEGNSRSTRADMVIGADGPSSTVRKILLPTIRRDYVGYVAWRGTIPELEASSLAKSTFLEKITYFHVKGMHILLYTIPGEKGAIEPGKRLLNYVWYCNYAQDSKEFAELMTDSDGNSHRITLPVGKLRPEVWNRQRDLAKKTLPALFSEIVCKTKQPFVQAITDVISSKNSFFDGKVLLVGDSIAGFRPHLGASTSQAAFDSQMLDKLMRGQLSLNEWEMETMRYARTMQEQSVDLGQLCQFGDHPMAQW